MSDRSDSRPRLLVVDDTPDNIHVLMQTLKDDYVLTVARSGEKALSMMARPPLPDLVLLDIMMPGIDGYEVCRRLKLDPRTRDIPVLFITALDEVQDEARGLGLGAADYITKPINPELVKARVRNHLALRTAMIALETYNDKLAAANRDLENTVAELKSLTEKNSEFMGIAVHDLKNPLSAISGFAQLLYMHATDEDQTSVPREKCAEMLEQIRDSASHMYDIINGLLETTRLDAEGFELVRLQTDLSDLAQHVTDLNRRQAEAKHIDLLLEKTAVCFADVDRQRIREVIDNLVSNAIKFSKPGQRVWVTVYNQDDKHSAISVRDEGPGLTEDDKKKLFGRFQKLSARPTGGESSSGLGLSIVRRLVDLHHGQIKVESEVGDGANFTVILPRTSA